MPNSLDQRNIFMTGATGFFGSRLLKVILDSSQSHLFLLIRPRKKQTSVPRLRSALSGITSDARIEDYLKRITIVEGDIAKEGLGMDGDRLKEIAKDIDLIYHLAADVNIGNSDEGIRVVNAYGTQNVLEFASMCKTYGRLKKLCHVSTAYVVGTKGKSDIVFREDDLAISQGFNNTYEESKYEAELAVNDYRKKGLAVDIYRPSILTDSIPVVDYEFLSGLFRPFHFIISGTFDKIPVYGNTKFNVVSAEDAAKAVSLISLSTNGKGRNYHIVNNSELPFDHALDIAQEVFELKRPARVPLEDFDMNSLTGIQRQMVGPFIPYFNFKARFDSRNADKVLKDKGFCYNSLRDDEVRSVFKYMRERMAQHRYVSV